MPDIDFLQQDENRQIKYIERCYAMLQMLAENLKAPAFSSLAERAHASWARRGFEGAQETWFLHDLIKSEIVQESSGSADFSKHATAAMFSLQLVNASLMTLTNRLPLSIDSARELNSVLGLADLAELETQRLLKSVGYGQELYKKSFWESMFNRAAAAVTAIGVVGMPLIAPTGCAPLFLGAAVGGALTLAARFAFRSFPHSSCG